jgi:hypothetical protein
MNLIVNSFRKPTSAKRNNAFCFFFWKKKKTTKRLQFIPTAEIHQGNGLHSVKQLTQKFVKE